MCGRLCCYKQQQHSKLYWLSLCLKCPPFALAHEDACAALPDCRINNALISLSQAVRLRRYANAVRRRP